MDVKGLIKGNEGKYICIKNGIVNDNNIIVSADIIKVYDTLEDAEANKTEIREMMSKYRNFDIIYGDYEDYVRTRYRVSENKKDKLSQEDIDMLMVVVSKGSDD